MGFDSDDGLINGLAMRDEVIHISEEFKLDAFSIKSFNSIPTQLGAGDWFGVICSFRSVSRWVQNLIFTGQSVQFLTRLASRINEPSFFPEFTNRHPTNDNACPPLVWGSSLFSAPSKREEDEDNAAMDFKGSSPCKPGDATERRTAHRLSLRRRYWRL
jgi:hypothetical protein